MITISSAQKDWIIENITAERYEKDRIIEEKEGENHKKDMLIKQMQLDSEQRRCATEKKERELKEYTARCEQDHHEISSKLEVALESLVLANEKIKEQEEELKDFRDVHAKAEETRKSQEAKLKNAMEEIERLRSRDQRTSGETFAPESTRPLDVLTPEPFAASEEESDSSDDAWSATKDDNHPSNPSTNTQVCSVEEELRGTDLDEDADMTDSEEESVKDALQATKVSTKRGRIGEQVIHEPEQPHNSNEPIPRPTVLPRAGRVVQRQHNALEIAASFVHFPSRTGEVETREADSYKRQKTKNDMIQQEHETQKQMTTCRRGRSSQKALQRRRKGGKTPSTLHEEWTFVPIQFDPAGGSHPQNASIPSKQEDTNF